MISEQVDHLRENLKKYFGYGNFRGNQEKIIRSILDRRNTFVIMPTGAGKSLCYQLPAIMQDGVTVVISPLIALMKNQVDQLNGFNIEAEFLNSTLSKSDATRIKKDVLSGKVKLLYVAPESLTKEEYIKFLKEARVSFIAVDEAHCISEWGHDFRPEYRRIRSIIKELGDIPIIALTATATPKVQIDIQKNLQMEESEVFKSSFNRENLYYEVRPKKNAKKQLIQYIKNHKGKSGIIYCLSRKKVEEIAEFLQVNDIKAAPYHAGLDASVRMRNQDAFLNEDVDVIVATIAFGMGIDKPDVRYVIHYNVPKSLEGYYQETGRAGRDGLEGNCIMFYSYSDIVKLEKFHKDKPVTERENAKILLHEVISYSESSVCRKKQLLHYFGEYMAKDCGHCDNCIKPKEKFDGTEYVVNALEAAKQTGERFGITHLVNVLIGSENQYVKSYQHDELPIFGIGEGKDDAFWASIVRQSLLNEFLEKDVDQIGVLKISDKGRNFLESPYPVTLSKDHDYSNLGEEEEPDGGSTNGSVAAYDEVLFEQLKNLRKDLSKKKNLPPYVIFQEPSLEEMATTYPTSEQELGKVNGVGMGKVSKFGKPFIELIKKYVDENDIITASDVIIKSAVNKSKIKIFIIQQIDMKTDLEEIAEAKNISMEELIEEIEHICYSGTKLNLDYYIDQIMDDDKQDDLYDYFLNAETDSIPDALDELGDEDFSEEEIRLMRVKFLSEYAN